MTGLSYSDVENTWIQAGGNPQAAAMAAAVADASSGLNPSASRTNPDGTQSIGLWLIPANGTPPGTTDALSNARAAIQLSNNGTDWSQWCVTWSDNNCGENNGTYLGEGANALGSLAQKLGPASYNVIGASPSGTNEGASSATSNAASSTGSSTTSSSTGGMSKVTLLIIVAALLLLVWFARKRMPKSGIPDTESEPTPE